jgi:AraC-like DNA-binding protein
MALLVDTTLLEPEVRRDTLSSMLTGATAAHDLTFLGPSDSVRARLECWTFGANVLLLQQSSSGIRHSRTEKHARFTGPERVVFVLHDGPPGSYVHDEKAFRLDRGALYVTDLNSCYSYTRPGDGTARIIQIERSALGMSVEQIQLAASRLPSSPLYALLRSHIVELGRKAETISDGNEAAAVGEATAMLAASFLKTALASPETTTVADFLLDRIRAYVNEHSARPDLSPAMVAAEHHISTRYLFKIWASQPLSLMETIFSARLAEARRLLITHPTMPIIEVAYRCGFENVSHFSRRFHQTFGTPPSGARTGQETLAPVVAQHL